MIHPDPGREARSSFETILYGPDGKEFDRRIIDATVYRGWAGSTFSGMWEDRGRKRLTVQFFSLARKPLLNVLSRCGERMVDIDLTVNETRSPF